MAKGTRGPGGPKVPTSKWHEAQAAYKGPDRHAWIRGRLVDVGRQATDIAIVWGRLEGKKKLDDAVPSNFIRLGTPVMTLERAIVLAELLEVGLLELTVRISDKPLADIVLVPLPGALKKKGP
jgi:hypothetical protein